MKRTFYLLSLLSCLSCAEDRNSNNPNSSIASENARERINLDTIFDEARWKTKDGFDYPYRDKMLGNLMNNQNLRALDRQEVLDLLGEPDRIDTNYLFYQVEQTRIGFFPLHTKTMVIKFSDEDTIEWVKVHK